MKTLIPIKGFEDRYLINCDGEIYSIKRKKFIIPHLSKNGYMMIGLWNNYVHKEVYLHRLIADNFINNPNKLECVNHKNHVRHDNRILNLEWCTNQENGRYMKKHKDNKSIYKNVYSTMSGKYTARIWFEGKNLYIGLFTTAKEAALAYNKKAKELFGDFALLNEVVA